MPSEVINWPSVRAKSSSSSRFSPLVTPVLQQLTQAALIWKSTLYSLLDLRPSADSLLLLPASLCACASVLPVLRCRTHDAVDGNSFRVVDLLLLSNELTGSGHASQIESAAAGRCTPCGIVSLNSASMCCSRDRSVACLGDGTFIRAKGTFPEEGKRRNRLFCDCTNVEGFAGMRGWTVTEEA